MLNSAITIKLKSFIQTKYKFDELFIYSSNKTKKISSLLSSKFDIGLIDGFIVNGLPKKINKLSQILKSLSSGYLYHYAFLFVFSIVVIFGIILARIL
jgi:NADH-quinone oxidoreductase subunit L